MANKIQLLVLVVAPMVLLALAILGFRFFEGRSMLPDLPQAAGIPEPVEAVDPACQEAGAPGADRPAPGAGQQAGLEAPAAARVRSGPEPPLLEVEVFSRKDGSEHRAAGARVVVSANWAEEDFDPISQEGGSHSGPEERPPSVTTLEFNCDAEGRALLPLGSIAWQTRRRWASFQVQAAAQDRRSASQSIRVELDRQGRFERAQPLPVLERMERLRIELHPNQSITVFVHDESGRGVGGIPVQLFNTASWLRTSGPKKLLESFPGISPLQTGPDGRCTFDFPLIPDIDRFRTCCVAGFFFPHGDHQRLSRKVTEEHFSGRQVELELPQTGSVEVVIEGGPGSGSVNKDS